MKKKYIAEQRRYNATSLYQIIEESTIYLVPEQHKLAKATMYIQEESSVMIYGIAN